MAIINYTNQLKYAGQGYLDAKMMPVNSVDDLKAISLTQRFEGLTITVLNNGNPQDYWLVGGITNSCWIPKTNGGSYSDLKLVLEDGFLKLMDGNVQLGENIDLNSFFPEQPGSPENPNDLYIASIDYTTSNENGDNGIFMCFTYSNGDKKYLNMSQFVQSKYEQGSGIVIDGNVISIDDAIIGRLTSIEETINTINSTIAEKATIESVEKLESDIETEKLERESEISELNEKIRQNELTISSSLNDLNKKINDEIASREDSFNEVKTLISNESEKREEETQKLQSSIDAEIEARTSANEEINNRITDIYNEISDKTSSNKTSIQDINSRLSSLISKVDSNSENISKNTTDIEKNKTDIEVLRERVNALSAAAEGSTPDGVTIGITDDEQKALYVKISEKEGNLITVDSDTNNGLYASISVFYEDEELN